MLVAASWGLVDTNERRTHGTTRQSVADHPRLHTEDEPQHSVLQSLRCLWEPYAHQHPGLMLALAPRAMQHLRDCRLDCPAVLALVWCVKASACAGTVDAEQTKRGAPPKDSEARRERISTSNSLWIFSAGPRKQKPSSSRNWGPRRGAARCRCCCSSTFSSSSHDSASL